MPENAPDAISESLKNKFPGGGGGGGGAPTPPDPPTANGLTPTDTWLLPLIFSQTLISPTLGTISK